MTRKEFRQYLTHRRPDGDKIGWHAQNVKHFAGALDIISART